MSYFCGNDLGADTGVIDRAEDAEHAPAGPRVGEGQRVIATVTMSPGTAPCVSFLGTWMSATIRRSNGTT